VLCREMHTGVGGGSVSSTSSVGVRLEEPCTNDGSHRLASHRIHVHAVQPPLRPSLFPGRVKKGVSCKDMLVLGSGLRRSRLAGQLVRHIIFLCLEHRGGAAACIVSRYCRRCFCCGGEAAAST
jgi:hypothetical protein